MTTPPPPPPLPSSPRPSPSAPVAAEPVAEPEPALERPLRPRLLVGGALVTFWTAFWTALGWGILVLPLLAVGAGVAFVVFARRRTELDAGSAVASARRLLLAGIRRAVELRRRVPPVSRPPLPRVSLRIPVQPIAARVTEARRSAVAAVERAVETRPIPRPRTMQDALAAVSEGARHRRGGRPREAAAAYERAATGFRVAGDVRATALALSNLGMSLARAGETDAAIARLEEAVALLRELGHYHAEGQVLANLGSVHGRAGRRDAALDYWRDAATRLDDDSPERTEVERRLLRAS